MRYSFVSLLMMVLVAGASCEDTSKCNGANCAGSATGGGSAGGGGSEGCDATNCAGCCDSQGQCQAGTSPTQCGNEGHACATCYHSSCNGVSCVPAPDGGGTAGGGDGMTGGGGGAFDGGTFDGGTFDGGANDAGLPTDGGINTYPDGGSLSSLWDGGSCAVMTDCPCFSSDECGPGFMCQSQGSDFDVYCVPGQRGSGLVGADCMSEADCLSSLCIDSADGGKACTALCGDDTECAPAVPSCNQLFIICTP